MTEKRVEGLNKVLLSISLKDLYVMAALSGVLHHLDVDDFPIDAAVSAACAAGTLAYRKMHPEDCTHPAFQNYNGVRYCHYCNIKLPKDQQPAGYDESVECPDTNPYVENDFDVMYRNPSNSICGYKGCEFTVKHIHFRNGCLGVGE